MFHLEFFVCDPLLAKLCWAVSTESFHPSVYALFFFQLLIFEDCLYHTMLNMQYNVKKRAFSFQMTFWGLFQVLITSISPQILSNTFGCQQKCIHLAEQENTCSQLSDNSTHKASCEWLYAVILCPYSETIHMIALSWKRWHFLPIYCLLSIHCRHLAA